MIVDTELTPVLDHDMVQKCHIGGVVHGVPKRSLCGRHGGRTCGTYGTVDLNWLNQPDPDEKICKTCKRIALKILSPPTA